MALTNLNASSALTQQAVTTALIGRLHFGSFMQSSPGASGMSAWRDGVIVTTNTGGSNNVPNDLQIKAAGSPSLNLTCEAGHCVITRSGQGPYLCYNPTQGTLTLAAADTVNPRIDAIVAQVYDVALGDTLPTTPALASPGGLVIRAVTGIPGGVPVAPSTPVGSILLAHVTVVQNDTTITSGDIADKRRSAFNAGGGRTQLPGDVATTDNGAVTGELRSTVSSLGPMVSTWSGTAWNPIAIPVYSNTTNRNADLGASGQYTGQIAIAGTAITCVQGGVWRSIGFTPGVPALQMRHNTTQSIPDNVFTTLAFDTEDTSDTFGAHDLVTNNSRFTAPAAGVYLISGGPSFAPSAAGVRGVRLLRNGTEIPGTQTMISPSSAGIGTSPPAKPTEVNLSVGDYVQMDAYQNSGGALLTAAAGSAHSTMCVTWVRDSV